MKSAAKPVSAPGSGPNSIPARKMGTASREKRVTSLGVGIRNRASTTLIAVSRAQVTMAFTGHLGPRRAGALVLWISDIKNTS